MRVSNSMPRIIVRTAVIGALVVMPAGPSPVQGQQGTAPPATQAQQRPVFRGGTHFVRVDAYPVRDGKIVEDLAAGGLRDPRGRQAAADRQLRLRPLRHLHARSRTPRAASRSARASTWPPTRVTGSSSSSSTWPSASRPERSRRPIESVHIQQPLAQFPRSHPRPARSLRLPDVAEHGRRTWCCSAKAR